MKESETVSPREDVRPRGIIIVGPGRHFGLELVQRFLDEGYQVGVVARHESTLAEMQGAADRPLVTAAADVSDIDGFGAALVDVAKRLGSVDGLIYNPKASMKASVLTTIAGDLERALSVNVTGAMVAVQTLLPWLEPAAGAVVLTGGGYKDEQAPDKFALSVGKAGLHALYRALSQPLQRRGVRMKTVVIDGAVRRHADGHASSARLAEFYWSVFEGGSTRVHRFPRETRRSDQLDMTF